MHYYIIAEAGPWTEGESERLGPFIVLKRRDFRRDTSSRG